MQAPLLLLSAQPRLLPTDYPRFYEWFHQQSPVADLYSDQATLYVFAPTTTLYSGPGTGKMLAHLPQGTPIRNLAYAEPELAIHAERNGLLDFWYRVVCQTPEGAKLKGYLWGSDLAKAWCWTDANADGKPEFVMLGAMPIPNKIISPETIRAEIKVLDEKGTLVSQSIIPGMCMFEACANSSLLRLLNDPLNPGRPLLEAATLTEGCESAVERAFFIWEKDSWQCVYYAEFLTGREFVNQPFRVTRDGRTWTCRFQGLNEQFNPLWRQEEVPVTRPAAIAAPIRAR